MSKKEATGGDAELDEHGLVIHKYVSTVLVVVPSKDYAETTLRYARSALFNVHVGTYSVSTVDDDLIHGALQDEFQVDGQIQDARMSDFSGLLLCGGPGALEMAEHPEVLRLVREAMAEDKLVGAWGHSVAVLARADVVRKRKVTGDPSQRAALEKAGAVYKGTQTQIDGKLVTAYDDAAGFRFGKALVQLIQI